MSAGGALVDPGAIDAKLLELADLLEDQARANYRLAIAAAEAEAEHKASVATTQLIVRDEAAREGAKLTEAQVDARVTDQTMDLLRTRLVAQAKHEAGRDSMFSTRARIDALRTIAASYREAAKG